jgi:hypothetical protein
MINHFPLNLLFYPKVETLDAVNALVRQQEPAPEIDRGLVDLVRILVNGVRHRDLDSIADDIICSVLQFDDLMKVVRERLQVQLAFREAHYRAPGANPTRAATDIIKAIHAVVRPRLSKERDL